MKGVHPVYGWTSRFVSDAVPILRVVGSDLEVCEQKRLAGWLSASSLGLSCYKDLIQVRECLGVIEPQYPSLVRVVLVEQAKTHVLLVVTAAPRLESDRLFQTGLLIEIIAVKHQRLVFRIKDPAKRLVCFSILRDIVNICDVKISRSYQVSDLPIMRKEFFSSASSRSLSSRAASASRILVGACPVRQVSFVIPMNGVGSGPSPREDGLLPTSAFERVFISYSRNYAALDPWAR